MKPTICLNMIVKNEAHVIERCLRSVLKHVTCAVIHDTGSTDDTIAIIRRVCPEYDKPVFVREVPWINFSSNRNAALHDAHYIRETNYILVMDADDTFHCDKMPIELTASVYNVEMRMGDLAYFRPSLFVSDIEVTYVGSVHEYLSVPSDVQVETLPNAYIKARSEGARSKDPNRWTNDIAMLLREAENGEPRAQYYLAQSYRNAGDTSSAILWYGRRARNRNGYFEEQWHAAYMKAKLTDNLHHYFEAYDMMPTRAEPLYRAAQAAGLKTATALMLLEAADKIDEPPITSLFVELDVYRYLIAIDLAVAYHYQKRYTDAIYTNERMLASNYISEDKKQLVRDNMAFSLRERDRQETDAWH